MRHILRLTAGVVGGYLVLAIVVFASLSAAYAVMGADRAFQPSTYDVSTLWMVTMFALNILAAVAGGWAGAAIGGNRGATLALAIVVMLVGILVAAPVLLAEQEEIPKSRVGDVGMFEAMRDARQPAWVALLNPWIGAAGVLLGGRLWRNA
ncbi:MAG: hypothetical protein ACE5HU_02825 [Acidobacteriota bacterium]